MLGAAAVGGAATLFIARNFFPSEKKLHHEIITDYAVGDDVFVRTMGNLLGPPLLKGNKVTALENGEQIFPALLKAIRSRDTQSHSKTSSSKKARCRMHLPKRWRSALGQG